MKLPILKYYLSAPFSLRLRLYIEELSLKNLTLEISDRTCLECLFYANNNPCDLSLLMLVQNILSWIKTYLSGKESPISFPMKLPLSEFSLLVLHKLLQVPYGKVITYQDLAFLLGKPTAARAVGTALNKNPLPLFIPCHRVVSKKDGIGGFAYPIEIKKVLLDFEKSHHSC